MNQLIEQLKGLTHIYQGLCKKSTVDDLSDLTDGEVVSFNARSRAAIHRVGGGNSAYSLQCEEIFKRGGFPGYIATSLIGVVEALLADATQGYLQSQAELIHGELFGDFLDMAKHLLDNGFKDAAAVITGSALEAHLRQLCLKNKIDPTSNGGPKSADRLNGDLSNANIYSKMDLKNVTAWLDLRNKAAHGHYDQYQPGQVDLLISGVRDFITRNPA